MTQEEIIATIAKIVAAETGAPSVTLTPQTKAVDIAGWDSIAHARILVALEDALAIEIDMDRGFGVGNVGQLAALLQEYQASKA